MTVYEAVFLAMLQSAMAEFGEWLRLLEAAPNHRERLAVSVHSARNCSLSKQEQQQDTVDSINDGGKETGQRWGVMEFGCVWILSAAAGAEGTGLCFGQEILSIWVMS